MPENAVPVINQKVDDALIVCAGIILSHRNKFYTKIN